MKRNDVTQMSAHAHAALLSQFAKVGGFFEKLVETCPMRLTSNNAPEVRDWVANVTFGNESALGDCEEADMRHLFKMRLSTRAFLSRLASASQRLSRPISAIRRHLRSPEAEIQQHQTLSVHYKSPAVENRRRLELRFLG